jgi:hypothetical protein
MKIPLIKLTSKKSQEFLNYFIASLKEKNKSPIIGSAYALFNKEGQYETTIQDQISNQSGNISQIQWKIVQNNDGSIPFIEVSSLIGTEPVECKDEINQFINDVWLSVFSQAKKSFFHRSYYCYLGSHNLIGEFWLDSNTRIASLHEDDKSFQPIAEKVIVIDQKVDAIDAFHSRQLGEELAIHIASFSSFMLDLGLYLPKREERWFIYIDQESNQVSNRRYMTGILDPDCPSKMPKRGKLTSVTQPFDSILIRRDRSFWENISLPIETKTILKAFEETNEKNFQAFSRFCRLYQIALCLGNEYPTIKLSYLYAGIDAICQTTENYKGFSDFIIRFLPEADKALIDLVHTKIRSAHWHSGTFYLGEDEAKTREYILDWSHHLKHSIMTQAHLMIRNAVINWIYKEIIRNNST